MGRNNKQVAAQKSLQDELTEYDKQWELCRSTGYTHIELLGLLAQDYGYIETFSRNLGFIKFLTSARHKQERQYWTMIAAWMKMFIPQWENKFVDTVNSLISLPSEDAIIEASAKALNISAEVLKHFIEHKEEISLFLEAQRSTLGVLAESQLWKLIAEGDAATVRWALGRIKPGIYGDNKRTDEQPTKITIIEG